ncbi:hypothetical protein BH23BAC1_BH23BAC1_46490 [soil metagenome]
MHGSNGLYLADLQKRGHFISCSILGHFRFLADFKVTYYKNFT